MRVLDYNPEKEKRDMDIDSFRRSMKMRKIIRQKIRCLMCNREFKSEDVCLEKMCSYCREYS